MFKDLINRIKNAIRPEQELLSPVSVFIKKSPTITPAPKQYRNPQMDTFKAKDPQSFNEILSAVNLATTEPTKRQIMMDLALEESGMRTNPPKNPNSSASGAWQFINGTANSYGINPLNATESAKAVSKIMDNGKLNWWEVLNKGGATRTPLSKLYTQEELAQYLR